MRTFLLLCLTSLIAFAISPIQGVIAATFEGWAGLRGHLALLPGTPRSIADTRRMGLA